MLERFAQVGQCVDIRPPFHCDYGFNISIADGVFLNFGCVTLDVVKVSIGAKTQIGPGVQILTADHPRDPTTRASGLEFGRPTQLARMSGLRAGRLFCLRDCGRWGSHRRWRCNGIGHFLPNWSPIGAQLLPSTSA